MLEQENDLSVASGFERSSKNKDFDTNSALDSGFLSGPQAIYTGEIDSALDDDSSAPQQSSSSLSSKKSSDKFGQQKIQIDTNIDSGCISAQMISTGGIGEGGLPDWFNNLSIKDSPSINNLDGTKDKSNQQPSQQQQQQQQKSSIEANLWELCYAQDSDGDT